MLKNLKPAEGLLIFDPILKDRLPPEGRTVEFSTYWAARVRDGDVEDVDAEAEAKERAKIGADALAARDGKSSGKKKTAPKSDAAES